MKVGVTLPSFRDDSRAVAAAAEAEALGLDGVFVFDHLWPIGHPDRPALSALPLLGAVAAVTRRVTLGPLVARVGLVPDEVLVGALLTLHALAPGRVVAALGTGDAKSAPENRAYGLPYGRAGARRAQLAGCARALQQAGLPVWVGGGSAATVELARDLHATVNLWEAEPAAVGALAGHGDVTWGGPVPGEAPAVAERLAELAAAGASWAVCAWPASLPTIAEAAAAVR